jgi:pimeloyl-ACP methyl ester carboxylesterase
VNAPAGRPIPAPKRRRGRTLALAAAGIGVAGAVAVAGERLLIRRARAAPDPDGAEPLAERPGEERRVRSFDGTELAVNVTGRSGNSRPTLVFVHGFTLDMTGWHFQWKKFSRTHRVVLFDQRGHGHSSPATDGDYSLEAMGRDLQAVLEATVPEGPAVLVGHSLGGMAILSLASLHPEEFGSRVQGVVLANTAASDILKAVLGNLGEKAALAILPYARRFVAQTGRAYRLRSRLVGSGGDLAFLIARITNFGPSAPPSVIDHVVSVAAEAPVEVWTDVMASLLAMDLGDAIHGVRVPALVIASDLDRLTPPTSARAIADRLPQGRLVEIRGAGHCSMLERPEEFNRVLEAFVTEAAQPGRERIRAGAAPTAT